MVFKCVTKITCGKMAIIMGTALAITAVSACMAPLLHCQDDNDDDSLEESKKTPVRTTGIVHKPQSSLMTIFLNGLRKIGIISSSTEKTICSVKKHQNHSAKVKTLFPCLPPIVPVIKVLKTPGNVPENLQELVHDSLVHPGKVSEDRNNNVVQQYVNIKLVLSKSSQSTQTDDFESARETTGTTEKSSMTEGSRTFSALPDPKTHDIGTQADSTAASTVHYPKSSAVDTQTCEKIIKPQIPKPPRAHPPRKIVIDALVHRDSSVSSSDQIQSHQSSNTNQTTSERPSNHSSRIRTTPTGRFGAPSSHHHSLINETHRNCSCVTPSSATMYHDLPGSKSSRNPGPGQSQKISDSPRSLVTKLRQLLTLRQISELSNCGDGSRHRLGMTAVQTNQSDHSSHSGRVYLAEASRSSSVIQDLENERSMGHYSNSEVMSSTRVHNVSNIEEQAENDAQVLSDDSGSKRADGDRCVQKAQIFLRDVSRVRWNVVAAQQALAKSRNHQLSRDDGNAIDEYPEVPSRSPEILLCDSQPNSRMYFSDVGRDYLGYRRRKKGIFGRIKDTIQRRFKGKNRSTFDGCDTTFERNLRWNLMGHSLHCTDS